MNPPAADNDDVPHTESVGWDQGSAPDVPPSYDYASLMRYDLQIRWTLYTSALPFVIPAFEWIFCSARFDEESKFFAPMILVGLLVLSGRSMMVRLGVNFLYLTYFIIQFKLFGDTRADGLPAAFYLMSLIGAVCMTSNLVATGLILQVDRMQKPVELENQIGRLGGSQNKLARMLEIYRTADVARANQAWAKKAGQQE